MAGGSFVSKDKVIPGVYINFVSTKATVQSVGQRGYMALPLALDYMPAGVTAITASEFNANALRMFGKGSSDVTLQAVREAFMNAKVVLLVSSNAGGTMAASTSYTAKQAGVVGNAISVVVQNALPDGYIMSVRFNGAEVERFRAATLPGFKTEVVSDYIKIKEAVTLAVGTETLTGAVAGSETVSSYTAALSALESEYWNTLACVSSTATVTALVEAYIRRLRDEQGKKVTAVLHDYSCDYEGIVVLNALNKKELVPWCAGALSAAPLNRSLTNTPVDGEILETRRFTYAEMQTAITSGLFTLVPQGSTVRVLKDINSLKTFSENKGKQFSNNQVVRIIDQIGNDILSVISDSFIGVIPNDEEGRAALWNIVVTMLNDLQSARAIQNFESSSVNIAQGESADSVIINCAVQPVGAVEVIYMTVNVI